MVNIYKYFNAMEENYTDEEITKVLELLHEDDIKLLKKRYGSDLKHNSVVSLSTYGSYEYLYEQIFKDMNIYLNKLRMINKPISIITSSDLGIHKSKYESSFDIKKPFIKRPLPSAVVNKNDKLKQNPISKEELKQGLMNAGKEKVTKQEVKKQEIKKQEIKKEISLINEKVPIKPKLSIEIKEYKGIVKNDEVNLSIALPDDIEKIEETNISVNPINKFNNNDFVDTLSIFNNELFKEIVRGMSVKESMIIALKFGFLDNKYYSIDSIAAFLDIPTSDVFDITRNALILFKSHINDLIDETIKDDKNEITRTKK